MTVSSFNNVFSWGNRLPANINGDGNATIKAVSVTLGGLAEFNAFSTAFNGQEDGGGPGNNGPYYTGTPTAGTTVFQWQMANLTAIDGLRFSGANVGGSNNLGIWELDGSTDGNTWFSLGQFSWNMTATGFDGTHAGCQALFGPPNLYAGVPFLYYRLAYVSGSFGGNRLCTGIEFRVAKSSTFLDQWVAGTIGFSSSLTVTGGTLARLHDGFGYRTWPSQNLAVTFNQAIIGDYFSWDFGAGNGPNIERLMISTSESGINMGTWKWQRSDDGVVFTDSGSAFTINNTSTSITETIYPGAAGTDYHRYWRLVCTVAPTSAMGNIYEFTLDLADQNVANVLPSHTYVTVFS